jgi:hypothetical protein
MLQEASGVVAIPHHLPLFSYPFANHLVSTIATFRLQAITQVTVHFTGMEGKSCLYLRMSMNNMTAQLPKFT